MYSAIILVNAQEFNGIDPKTDEVRVDKNGKKATLLSILAGKCPNRNVISGTVAEDRGFVHGKTYLAQVQERPENDFGRQFNFTKLSEATPLEIIQAAKELGTAEIFSIDDGTSKENEPEEIVVPNETE